MCLDDEALDRLLTKLRVRALPAAMEPPQEIEEADDGFIDEAETGTVVPETSETTADTPADDDVSSETASTSDADREWGEADEHPLIAAEIEGDDQADDSPSTDSSTPQNGAATTREDCEGPPPEGPTDPSQRRNRLGLGRGGRSTGHRTPPSGHAPASAGQVPGQSSALRRDGAPREEFDENREQRGRARTYVNPKKEAGERKAEAPERQTHRRRVDQAAVQRALQFERDQGRDPKEMPHSNEGYDIESFVPGGQLERYIEVKGISGAWTDFGVPVSRLQFQKAQKEKSAFWLYVVEFALEPSRARIYAIQSPAELVDEYWFDGGWRDYSTERGGAGLIVAPKKGSVVVVDGARRGTITDIHKKGVLMHLDVEFEDAARQSIVYNPRRVQVLPEEESE